MKKLIIIILSIVILASCSVNISRPKIEGNIYDIKSKQIEGVEILTWNGKDYEVETHSDTKGHFILKQNTKTGTPDQKHLIQFLLRKKNFSDTLISQFYGKRIIDKDTTVRFDSIILMPQKN